MSNLMKLKAIYWRIRDRIFWKYLAPLQWKNFQIELKSPAKKQPAFTIGVVTYIARYETYFKKLIHQLAILFPETEIVVIANGYYDIGAQNKYIKTLKKQIEVLSNVKCIVKEKPEGLSKLWNTIIIHSSNSQVFIFNDDISISPYLKRDLCLIKTNGLCLINNSWSHYLIHKSILNKVGWFDERFEGIGNEDQDYEFRLLNAGILIENYYTNKIRNEVEQPSDYSYGKDMQVVNNKYSAINEIHMNKKWNIYTKEQANTIYSKKFNIWYDPVPNLTTPNFYPDITFSVH